jgi:hypothetical protein
MTGKSVECRRRPALHNCHPERGCEMAMCSEGPNETKRRVIHRAALRYGEILRLLRQAPRSQDQVKVWSVDDDPLYKTVILSGHVKWQCAAKDPMKRSAELFIMQRFDARDPSFA